MHRKAAQVLKQVFVLFFVLLLAFFAQALVRTNVIAASAPPAARQTVRRIKPAPAPAVRIIVLDGVTYPRTDAGFSAALTAAGARGTVLLPRGATIILTSAHVISTDGTTVRCAAGAGFVSGVNRANLITVRGSDDAIVGCQFRGGADPASDPIFLWNSSGAKVERNFASGFVGISASFVYLVGARASTIEENHCVAGPKGAGCIFGEKGSVDTLVQSNRLNVSLGAPGSHAIAFHSTTAGQTVSGTKILSNRIVAGPGYCVEVGAFGGGVPQKIIISSNSCSMSTDGLGGYSVGSDAKFWTVSKNTFRANGHKLSISCIEVAGASDGTVAGNSCDGGNISLSNWQAQRVTISSNRIYGLKGWCAAIYLGTSVPSGAVNYDRVVANQIRLPAGTAAIGIWQQCNAAGATCNNNSYSYNVIVSDGARGSIGIKLENDAGMSRNERVGPNTLRSPSRSIDPEGLVSYTITKTGADIRR